MGSAGKLYNRKRHYLSQEFDLATTGKRSELKQTIEKEFAVCDCCGENIVPRSDIMGSRKNRAAMFS